MSTAASYDHAHQHRVKSRGMSPFRKDTPNLHHHHHHPDSPPTPTPTSTAAAHHGNHHHHHHHNNSKSPLRMRSLSPFGRTSSHNNSGGKNDGAKMICHQSAHAVVFRDHLRLARKIIQEIDEDNIDEDEMILVEEKQPDGTATTSRESNNNNNNSSDSDSDSDDNDNDEDEGGAAAFRNLSTSLKSSLKQSLRTSISHEHGDIIVQELSNLAHDLVPELQTVKVDLANISERNMEIEGLHAHIVPLMELEFSAKTEFHDLLLESQNLDTYSEAERQVYDALQTMQATVKTIQKQEWPTFLKRFVEPHKSTAKTNPNHVDQPPLPTQNLPYNSFVTSTTLLPRGAHKMRVYGSEQSYPVGVVFLLPTLSPDDEAKAVHDTETWAWPAGYAAKTEFNIDNRGRLINGRQEALVSLQQLRTYNDEYTTSTNHFIGGRYIAGGFSVVPYNEAYVRVGGPGRLVGQDDKDAATGHATKTRQPRSLDKGVGLFAALFVRTTTMGDIMNLFRTRARIAQTLGPAAGVHDIPLLYLHHEHGVRVFTRALQDKFWKLAAHKLQPFLNPSLAPTLKYHDTNEASLFQKLQESLDDGDLPLATATHHEMAKIAGGFGLTDPSVVRILQRYAANFKHVQDMMQDGFAATIRAGDYYTARQLLILYAAANTAPPTMDAQTLLLDKLQGQSAATFSNHGGILKDPKATITVLPTPLPTKRLRRATNTDGLLVVLGAAQILKTIATTSAKRRTEESYVAVEEWVHHGEESVAFRVASWREQRADEADANIAMSKDSAFMAFVTNKSVHNRRKFAQQLRKAAPEHNFTTAGFLQGIYEIVEHMHSPCMRLELLQYILGLDNRYSVHLIKESIELAATCLSVVSQ